MAEPVPRPAVRVLLFDSQGRVLLQRFLNRRRESIWITPGGGLQPGESDEEGARRELREEIGLTSFSLGSCVWVREHVFEWDGRHYRQQERYYLAEAAPFEVDESNLEGEERAIVQEHRWWTADDIEAAAGVLFVPRRLAHWLRRLAAEVPAEPVDVGV
ncbi:MAG TPA: NUDIX domain-containing protein [Candidatus Acidoferrales bacterium]|nr:NUDIX domain-containing protein [Candidatus Acidoferrales bacterium]